MSAKKDEKSSEIKVVRASTLEKSAALRSPFSGSPQDYFCSIWFSLIFMLRRSLFAVVAFALLAPVEPFLLQPSRALAGGAASVLTYHAQTFGVGVVPAAAAVGLASGVALPAWRLPLYCGAFAGMSSAHLLSCQLAALAGGIASGYVLPLFDARSHFVGHGGRLGYAAMVATVLTWALFVVSAGAAPLNIITLPPPRPAHLIASLIGPQVGALATKALMDVVLRLSDTLGPVKVRLGNSVSASSAIGLLFAWCLPAAWHAPVFLGSFVSMSAPELLVSYVQVAGAAAVAALIGLFLSATFVGFGGRIGVSAVLGVAAWLRIRSAHSRWRGAATL